ncbi:MAG TPA: glycosyltransferase family 39 protein [Victivallales bacterium]|nr:glycosyltransferase family 39 protein [Victivallales bacterium]
MKKFNFYFYLLLTLAIAFIVRIYISDCLLSSDISIAYPLPYTDMATYRKLAIEISRNIYPSQFTYQPFYYAVFLSNIFKYLGLDIVYVILIQSLLGLLTILFSALTAKLLWNRNAAIITAILVTFSHALIFYTPYMLIVTLQAFWLSLILYISISAYKKHDFFLYLLLGVVVGCSILTRGNMWILVPIFVILALYSGIKKYHYSETKRPVIIIVPAIILIIFIILPQLPFIIQNSISANSLRGPSNAGIAVFGLGNAPDSPPGGLKYTQTYKNWISENGGSDFLKKYYTYIKNNKLHYLDHFLNKLLLFWDYREIPNNTNINLLTNKNFVLKIGFVTTPIIIILGLSGLFLFFPFRKKKSIYLLSLSIVFFYWISISLFYILARFRAPLIPVLSVYAGGFLNYIFFTKQTSMLRKWVITIFLLLISIYITFFLYDFYYLEFEPYISKKIRKYGTVIKLGKIIQINDNAPKIFASRYLVKLNNNDQILKKYKLKHFNDKTKTGKLEILVFACSSSQLQLKLNGVDHSFKLKKGIQKINLTTPLIYDERNSTLYFKIIIIKTTSTQYFFMDRQRQYSRTIINNDISNSELIAKLIIPNISVNN